MEIDFTEQILADEGLAKKFTSKRRNDLPDSDFAYIAPGGKKVDGKTEPRSLRHFPIPDAAHVRNALARLSQSKLSPEVKAKILKKLKSKAKEFGIKVSETKAYHEDDREMQEHLERREGHWDRINLLHESLLEKIKHHKGAVENVEAEIKSLHHDLKYDKSALKRES